MTTSGVPRVIAVTGASGYIGEMLVRRLVDTPNVDQVIGIDLNASNFTHRKLTSLRHDITLPLDLIFRDASVEAVVHLAFVLRQLRNRRYSKHLNVGGAVNVLNACASAHVRKILLMSSATVYGPTAREGQFLSEDASLNPSKGFNYATDKVVVEMLCDFYRKNNPEVEVSILRGCVVMGPTVDNFITQALRKPLLIGVKGDDPQMQFTHEDDLIEILMRFIEEHHPGTFNVASPGTVSWSEVVRMAGKPFFRLPASLAYALVDIAWHLRIQNDAPSAGLDYVRWPWVVDTDRLKREINHTFKHSSVSAIRSYLERPLPTPL